jgi:hypothetical protein
MRQDSVAEVLLRGLNADERERVVTRLAQAAQDERAAAEAGNPRPFPGHAPRAGQLVQGAGRAVAGGCLPRPHCARQLTGAG